VRFFEASAIVKRYVRERQRTEVRRLMRVGEMAVSRLSEVEVISAFARVARETVMSHTQRDRAAAAFVADLDSWHVVEVTPEVTATARRLLMQHSLRSGDAVQLASALILQAGIGQALLAVVAYDQRVLDAARAEQLLTVGG
jgi:predicted nucleic acid-binding protein